MATYGSRASGVRGSGAASYLTSVCGTEGGKALGRMVIGYRKINKLMGKTQWEGNLGNFSRLGEQRERRFYFVRDAKAGFLQTGRAMRPSGC